MKTEHNSVLLNLSAQVQCLKGSLKRQLLDNMSCQILTLTLLDTEDSTCGQHCDCVTIDNEIFCAKSEVLTAVLVKNHCFRKVQVCRLRNSCRDFGRS